MSNPSRPLLFVIASITAALAVGGILAATNLATSQESPGGHVDFAKITPIGVTGLEDQPSNYPPRPDNQPTCQAEATKPAPDLPPDSCRYSGNEPPPGLINTPEPSQDAVAADAANQAPSGWTVINNRAFRFTLAIPPDWYSNMREEGGEFMISDPIGTQLLGTRANLPGGIIISFKGGKATQADSGGANIFIEEKLETPNANFGGTPALIWEEGPLEDLVLVVRAAFIRKGVLFQAYAAIEGDISLPGSADAASAQVAAILATIEPY
jgi:hypothetical protein